ncbi:DNA recombination protein RmuC [Aliikangiella sp. IMCC44359]|uniref:DNA recombination protein RmuC n=1 Tax=Aliikangiella sp. IMCC44359 TaxID=3459125 RepID=UPI00403A87CD
MQNWFSLLNFEVVLALAAILILLLLIVLLSIKRQQAFFKKSIENIHTSMLNLSQQQNEFQANIEMMLANGQQRLFNTIMQNQDKQVSSISELQLKLERRFSESGSLLSENLQTFKLQMFQHFASLKSTTEKKLSDGHHQQTIALNQFAEKMNIDMAQHQTLIRNEINEQINQGIKRLRDDLERGLTKQSESLEQSISKLTLNTDNRLKEISGQVEKRLADGFNQTNQTFNDVVKRLALIDAAQKKITELSSNVVSLQEILNDKRSRGAYGEVQLLSLISNTMPSSHYTMQKKLSNTKIADCVLLLPEPTGKIAIDAKFPLENYKKMSDLELAQTDRIEASKLFSKDIKKHINDIANKYILPPETTDGAVMFIPAESIFAEIHGHLPELVEFAYQKKVWMVSPTTLMAILTTASAVIKDEQTRKQVHVIKEHLQFLSRDFERFQERMDNLSKHIGQVSKDVENVHVSARKISSRFSKIERVELNEKASEQLNEEALKTIPEKLL